MVISAQGRVIESWGDVGQQIYPRSAIKPLQALPFLESGAADAYQCSDKEVALACASHMSQPHHVQAVRSWLARLDLDAATLECGAHAPRQEDTFADALRAADTIDRAYNNCSGKHTGFLSTARHLGEPTAGYIGPDHPVQERLLAVLGDLGDADLSATARGIDGCGIPVIGMPLVAMGLALARLADPSGLAPERARAAGQIYRCMTTHPEYVRGHGGFDTMCMTAGQGRFATKTGAEGVHAGIVPELGLGIAIKIEDGNGRATDVAMAALLGYLGLIDETAKPAMSALMAVVIPNAAGDPTGEIRMAAGWTD